MWSLKAQSGITCLDLFINVLFCHLLHKLQLSATLKQWVKVRVLVSPRPAEGSATALTTTPANSRARRASSRRRVPASLPPQPPPGETTDDSVSTIFGSPVWLKVLPCRWLESGLRCLSQEQLQWLQVNQKLFVFLVNRKLFLLWSLCCYCSFYTSEQTNNPAVLHYKYIFHKLYIHPWEKHP